MTLIRWERRDTPGTTAGEENMPDPRPDDPVPKHTYSSAGPRVIHNGKSYKVVKSGVKI